jgi:hypothetical protein
MWPVSEVVTLLVTGIANQICSGCFRILRHRTSAEPFGRQQHLHDRPRPLHEHKYGRREKVLVFLLD